ncbi:hypothetical protein CsatB_015931 [Cannabis sativa]
MDAYSGYNQISMHPPDQEHTSFRTDVGLYCYKVMPFGLKNAGATYQRLVNRMFKEQIGRNMEVYVDDMLVKSKKAQGHIEDLKECFEILRQYRMKLNPLKCSFGVSSGKFLGFIVNSRGIEANPEKIKALIDMKSPTKVKDVQSLTGRIAALSRFVSKSTDKCVPFFNILREHAVSAVLVREEDRVQHPVYYVSKRLIGAECRYPLIEKLAYCLILASRKLRPYFQAHPIMVLTDQPLRQVLQKPDTSGRLLKWAIELGQYDITYQPRLAIKGQALADFVAECTGTQEGDQPTITSDVQRPDLSDSPEPHVHNSEKNENQDYPGETWKLQVDGSSTDQSSGAGITLTTPEGQRIHTAIRFGFPASNNEAEYEALIAGLKLAKELKARHLDIYSDSQLVVNQVLGEYMARGEKMMAYLSKIQDLLAQLEGYTIQQIPREENATADALARLATSEKIDKASLVPIEYLPEPSIHTKEEVLLLDTTQSWMTPIAAYLEQGTLPTNKNEAKKMRRKATRYLIIDGVMYRRGYSMPLLRCVHQDQAQRLMEEVHEGFCGNHAGGQSLSKKVLRQGFFWPTMIEDSMEYVRRTTERTATGDTPFALAYGYDAMIPVELDPPSHRRVTYNQVSNHQMINESLDLLENRREASQIRLAAYQQKVARYFNSKVKERSFKVGDLVLRRVLANTKDPTAGVLGPNWEGPYEVTEVVPPGTYRLGRYDSNMNLIPVPRYWNDQHLRKYYQ